MSAAIRRSIALATLVLITVGVAAMFRPAETRAHAQATGSALGFVQANKKYAIRWQPGDTEIYTVLEIRDGWARGRRDQGDTKAEGAGKPTELWLNLNEAITITEAK